MVWFDGCRVAYGTGRWHSMGHGAWLGAHVKATDLGKPLGGGGEKRKLSQHHLPSLKATQTMPGWGGCPLIAGSRWPIRASVKPSSSRARGHCTPGEKFRGPRARPAGIQSVQLHHPSA